MTPTIIDDRVTSVAFREYAALLVRLHRFIRAEDDGPEADAVRDAMDGPWWGMSEDERRFVGGLSEDLYQIGVHPVEASDAAVQISDPAIIAAYRRNDWPELLRLFRETEFSGSRGLVMAIRGRCWNELGSPEIALEFDREAARLLPGSPDIVGVFLVRAATHLPANAFVALANRYLNHEHPEIRANAAGLFAAVRIQHRKTHKIIDGEARRLFSVMPFRSTKPEPRVRIAISRCYAAVGYMIAQTKGGRSEAIDCFIRALAIDPNLTDAMVWLSVHGGQEGRMRAKFLLGHGNNRPVGTRGGSGIDAIAAAAEAAFEAAAFAA